MQDCTSGLSSSLKIIRFSPQGERKHFWDFPQRCRKALYLHNKALMEFWNHKIPGCFVRGVFFPPQKILAREQGTGSQPRPLIVSQSLSRMGEKNNNNKHQIKAFIHEVALHYLPIFSLKFSATAQGRKVKFLSRKTNPGFFFVCCFFFFKNSQRPATRCQVTINGKDYILCCCCCF